jgi:hypothetical protein
MNLLKKIKYNFLQRFLRNSFIGFSATIIFVSVLFISTKICSATGPTLTVLSTTSNSVTLVADGLIIGNTYRINVIQDFNGLDVIKSNWDLINVSNSTITTTSPNTQPLILGTYVAKLSGPNGAGGYAYIATSPTFSIVPKITSFSPASARWNDIVTIIGDNFQGATQVYFGEIISVIPETNTGTVITVKVPRLAVSGTLYVRVPNYSDAPSPTDFIFDQSPLISNVSPTSGKEGDLITITGLNFTNITKILFNTKNSIPEESSPTLIKVKVPKGATSGLIKIETESSGSSTSATSFTVNNPNSTQVGGTQTPSSNTTTSPSNMSEVKFKGLVPVCNTILNNEGGFDDPCNFNMVMAIINKVISFLLFVLATPLFALIIIYVGYLYLTDMGNAQNITKAKTIFKNAIFGYVIALAAWLIVKTILLTLKFSGSLYLG